MKIVKLLFLFSVLFVHFSQGMVQSNNVQKKLVDFGNRSEKIDFASAKNAIENFIRQGAVINGTDTWGQTALLRAAGNNQENLVRALLNLGANVNQSNMKTGWTPLLTASAKGHVDTVRILLEAGANLNARDKKFGSTPLIWATQENHIPVVSLLLQAGVNKNQKNNEGQTQLILATKMGYENLVKFLLQAGADKFIRDDEGKIALDYAKGSIKEMF